MSKYGGGGGGGGGVAMVKNGEICKFWDPIHHKIVHHFSPFFTISIVIFNSYHHMIVITPCLNVF